MLFIHMRLIKIVMNAFTFSAVVDAQRKDGNAEAAEDIECIMIQQGPNLIQSHMVHSGMGTLYTAE